MAKVSLNTRLGVSADEAWKLIGGFNALLVGNLATPSYGRNLADKGH